MIEKTLTRKGDRIRRRMIDITARILREQGFRSATVRRIAGEARVNISSVRYYFGSKEQLISLAMDSLISELEKTAAHLDDPRLSPRERLRKCLAAYVPLARKHPAVFKLLSNPAEASNDTYFLYLTCIYEQYWPKFSAAVGEAFGLTDRDDIAYKAMQLLSAVEFPILLENMESTHFPLSWSDDKDLDKYLSLLLGPPEEP